ncbi:MAG: hypothetical protein LDLANPLL_02419 [Turneriella sp.]|nr:hypothetical protein [Turneriella sp.]
MNYPTQVKKAFTKLRFSAADIWQNLRVLKKEIQCLVRNIDNVGACVVRNRRLLQSIEAPHENVTQCEEKWNTSSPMERL